MFKRKDSGPAVCRSCGLLVGVNDKECYHCGARNPGLWGYSRWLRNLGHDMGFIRFAAGACVILYLLSLAIDSSHVRTFGGGMSFLAPSLYGMWALGVSGATPVFGLGHWWTVFSAGWLHGGVFHIDMNLYWLFQVGPIVAEIYGPGRMIVIYSLSSALGFLVSSWMGLVLWGGSLTLGASAATFGLFGAIVYSGRRGGSTALSRQIRGLAIIIFIMGFLFPFIDNWAHAGGFAGGWLLGRWMDPMKPERVNHLVLAVVCLVASGLAILTSFLNRPPASLFYQ